MPRPDTRVSLGVRLPTAYESIVVAGTGSVANVHAASESVEVVGQRHMWHVYSKRILRL